MNERPHVQQQLSRYVQALALHSAQTGLCGVRHCRDHRLACWLCVTCDAIGDRVLPVTHDYLSGVLGLRRPGVTETLTRFEEKGLIRKTRGVLHIDDRERLELEACSCYGVIANAYASSEDPALLDPGVILEEARRVLCVACHQSVVPSDSRT
nr:helix-turn-helix domain-containing protein [Bradyrhizobium erythrophlei]